MSCRVDSCACVCLLLFLQSKHTLTHIHTHRQAPLRRHTCKVAGNLLHVQLQLATHSLTLTSWTCLELVFSCLARALHARVGIKTEAEATAPAPAVFFPFSSLPLYLPLSLLPSTDLLLLLPPQLQLHLLKVTLIDV